MCGISVAPPSPVHTSLSNTWGCSGGWQHTPGYEHGKSTLKNEISPHGEMQQMVLSPITAEGMADPSASLYTSHLVRISIPGHCISGSRLPQGLSAAEAASLSFPGALGWKTPWGWAEWEHLHNPAFGLVAADKKRFLRVGSLSLVQPEVQESFGSQCFYSTVF